MARRAGELQISRYRNPGEVREKAPKDFVTEVDLLCEELMVNAIGERFPGDAILSEERGGSVSESGRTWLLDPVDGTANYMKANPMFCACVSVIEGGSVTHAAVAAPHLGDLYHARSGGGAFRESGGRETPLRVSDTERLEYAVAGADLSLHGGKPQDPGVESTLQSLATKGSGQRGDQGRMAGGRVSGRLRRHPQHGLGLRPDGPTRLRSRGTGHGSLGRAVEPLLRWPDRHQRRPAR